MKIDFTKFNSFIYKIRLPLILFSICFTTPLLFHWGYISVTQQYYFIIIDLCIGLCLFAVYETFIGKALYGKSHIPKSKIRKKHYRKKDLFSKIRDYQTSDKKENLLYFEILQ